MKKILIFILVFIFVAFATQQSLTTFTGATLGANDTVLASGNFTIDTSVSIGALWFPSGTNYTLTKTGTQTLTLNNKGIVFKDSSTGAKTYPDSIVMMDNSKMLISSLAGTVTAATTKFDFHGNDTVVDNKTITANKIYVAAGKHCVILPATAPNTIFNGTSPVLTMGNGAKFSGGDLTFQPTSGGKVFNLGANDTINPLYQSFAINPRTTNNVNDTFSAFIGISNWRLEYKDNVTNCQFNFNDILGGATDLWLKGFGCGTRGPHYRFLGHINVTILSFGNGAACADTSWLSWGSGTDSISNYDMVPAAGTAAWSVDSLNTATIWATGSWTNNSTYQKQYPGTSKVIFYGAAAKNYTSSNQNFYDITLNKTNAVGTYSKFLDSVQMNDFTWTDGQVEFDSTTYMRDAILNATDTIFTKKNNYVSRDLTFASGNKYKRGVGAWVLGTTNDHVITLSAPTVDSVNLLRRATINGGGAITWLSYGQDRNIKIAAGTKLAVTVPVQTSAAGHPDSIQSATAGVACTLSVAANTALNHHYFKDVASVGVLWDTTSGVSGGNNYNIRMLNGMEYTVESDTVGKAIIPITHTVTSGTVDSFHYAALPSGLSGALLTGTITGTPLSATAKAAYRIVGYGSKMTDSVSVYDTITVYATPVVTTSTHRRSCSLGAGVIGTWTGD